MGKRIIFASRDSFEFHSIYMTVICRYAFATFDTNRDGSISFEEFLLALSATSRGDVDDRLAFAFDL
jgi:Ca2+-binding EF-hand superfamily protein